MTTVRIRVLVLAVAGFALVAACSDSKPASAPSSTSSASHSSASSSAPARALRVLVSNDDGVAAPGIDALVVALTAEPDVEVTVVAPAENQSGSGGQTSPTPPSAGPATTASGHPATAVQGFPADAVDYGLANAKDRPDLVMSGVNAGQNIGPFVDVSGTIGAARAAAQQGIPALAVSAGLGDPIDFQTATADAIEWLRDHRAALVASSTAPSGVANLNAPTCPSGHARGVVEVAVESTAAGADALAAPDCASTAPATSGDVSSFHLGFATLSQVPLRAAA